MQHCVCWQYWDPPGDLWSGGACREKVVHVGVSVKFWEREAAEDVLAKAAQHTLSHTLAPLWPMEG